MPDTGLWKYCTREQCRELLLSFRLLGDRDWTAKKQLSCLYAVSNHAEKHYHPVKIRKRDGSFRQLYVPDPLLKGIQKRILHEILDKQPVSPYATAYFKGARLRDNGAAHVGKEQVLKLDVEDFFGSITFPMVYQKAFPGIYYPEPVRMLLTKLCCYEEKLPQGAPTSAAISNLVMKPFDTHMGGWCLERGISYTRYCDDMTFSGTFDAGAVIRKVRGFLEAMGFSLNEKKTQLLKQGQRQVVTGVVVNEKPQAPKSLRRQLRQEWYYCKKYGVKAHLSHKNSGKEPEEAEVRRYLGRLLGQVQFVLQLNSEDLSFQQMEREIRAFTEKT